MDELRRRWTDLLNTWEVAPALADRAFEELSEHYSGPGRFYHTLDHIKSMLDCVDNIGFRARNVNAVRLANLAS